MANHLSDTSIATLLAKKVYELKPGDLDDLKDGLDRIKTVRGGDKAHGAARAEEATLANVFVTNLKP